MERLTKVPRYAELHCLSNFSFLRGASHPWELVERAAELGYTALALTDECSMAGIVRAHGAAREAGIKLIVGSELLIDVKGTDAQLKIVVLAPDRQSYAALCALITRGRRAAGKGHYRLAFEDLENCLMSSACLALWLPDDHLGVRHGVKLKRVFKGRLWVAVELLCNGLDQRLLADRQRLANQLDLPLVAAGDVHMHARDRQSLQDTLTAIRLKTRVETLGFNAWPNAERSLRLRKELARLYPPELLEESVRIAERVDFSLDELRYEYPQELVPAGQTPQTHLRALTEAGLQRRWPDGVPGKVRQLIEHELALIRELEYEPYFLTVEDIVRFARYRGILCQGRGSAANSAVCYALGITEVDPARMQTLVGRFISRERDEPPDIDVDFENDRREEVIQYLYNKYSRERAALAATVITYRSRSAVRDVGKALGFDDAPLDALAGALHWRKRRQPETSVAETEQESLLPGKLHPKQVEEAGMDPRSPKVLMLLTLVEKLIGFPRHLSQHVGGFVISQEPLSRLVPIENASMEERTIIQWDKNDLEELGLLKVDILALGMLSAIRRCLDIGNRFHGRELTLASIPSDDSRVYDMICRADTVGVFQIESRAQMTMLPRLKPRCYYDLVIEVALVRPGPIQGDMVHPYLKRRRGDEAVNYPSDAVRSVLERTLGVPIFQEQVMQLAIVAAGFTPGEADQVRRAMAAWRRHGKLETLETRLIDGMRARGYSEEFARRIYGQIQGFGEYGFPESHSASFALLVYVSAWLKCHDPAAFYCALLNSQPMGFYAPAQLVRAAKQQGVQILPADVQCSDWAATLVPDSQGHAAIRLGLQRIKGLARRDGEQIAAERLISRFANVQELARRAELDAKAMGALAASGALKNLSNNRYRARWDVAGVTRQNDLLEPTGIAEGTPLLGRPTEWDDAAADYRSLGLSLGRHPMAMLRSRLTRRRIHSAQEFSKLSNRARVKVAGIVIGRQRPSSASGVVFVTLEDETDWVNVIVRARLAEQAQNVLLKARLLGVDGRMQREGDVMHVVADRLHDYSDLLGLIEFSSRDFH